MIFCLYLVGLKPDFMAMFTGKHLEGWRRFGYAAAYTTAAWFWIFGILGAALRFCSGFSARRRYLADASYWLYLMHLPVIVYLQVVMANLPLHWSFKFTAILAVTTALGLISYHYLVRSTFIGSILNGRRYPGMRVGAGTTAGRTSSGVIGSGLPLYKGAENHTLTGYAHK